MGEHTPLPWTTVDPAALDYREPLILGNDGTCRVAWLAGGGPKRAVDAAEARANAAFIVRACNSHEALVNVLTDARNAIASLPMETLGYASDPMGEQIHWPIRDELLHRIDEALRDVVGEARHD